MSTNDPSSPSIDAESRKRIVMLGGILLALLMVLAFVFGNPFHGDKEDGTKDEAVSTAWRVSTEPENSKNWLNQPTLPVLADTTVPAQPAAEIPAPPQTTPLPTPTPGGADNVVPNSSAAAGVTAPTPPPANAGASVVALNSPAAAGTAPSEPPPSAGSTAMAQNSPAAAGTAATTAAPTTPDAPPTKFQTPATSPGQRTTADPVVAAAPANPSATSPQAGSNQPASMPSNSEVGAASAGGTSPSPSRQPNVAASSPVSSATQPPPAVTPPNVATDQPVGANDTAQKSAPLAVVPDFIAPPKRRGQIVAQSKNLITQAEVRNSPAAGTSSQAQASSPAIVAHEEARQFARQATETLKAKGLLQPGQTARLPRSSETPNTQVWREDDQPSSAEERRPFGVVIAEDEPADSANSAFTPERIPERTDIPPGTSPLEKTGPDKPLWKRPQ